MAVVKTQPIPMLNAICIMVCCYVLRHTTRKKNGKEHRCYSLVENKRVASGRVVQRHALDLGEINDNQQEAWLKAIEIFEEGQTRPRTVALFSEERTPTVQDADIVRI